LKSMTKIAGSEAGSGSGLVSGSGVMSQRPDPDPYHSVTDPQH
jgi:hypothetical protein